VDVFLGPGATPRIVEAVAAALKGRRKLLCAPLDYLCTAETPRVRTGVDWLAYVKIADGCDNRCTYCTVPYLRGPYRSRPPEDLRREVERLAAEGVREMVLIAQDTSNYGRDLQPRSSLVALLRGLSEVAYDGWLRVMYVHPAHLSGELLEAMAETPAVVPYLDLPLQHAAPEVLRRMGRSGSAKSYLRLIKRIRKRLPEAALRTTFIVGFPGETEADFQTLLDFVREAHFDRLSAFRYWPEEGTPATGLPDQVPVDVAEERLGTLLQVQEKISLANNERLVGQRLRVLVEEIGPEEAVGRSYRDAPEVDGQVWIQKSNVETGRRKTAQTPSPPLAAGQFVEVEVTAAETHDLIAKPCAAR
jgi:ribosomal protein S12 methylthiotransferase